MDTKKKELIGAFHNGGREWRPKGQPERVKVHDFVDKELGKAIPYGVYDVTRDPHLRAAHPACCMAPSSPPTALRQSRVSRGCRWLPGAGGRPRPDAERVCLVKEKAARTVREGPETSGSGGCSTFSAPMHEGPL